MSLDVAHRSPWRTFEVVLGIPFLAAIALQMAVPLSFPRGFLTAAIVPAGIGLIILGTTLVVLARREFTMHGQPTDPGLPTHRIVTTGVFSISRNPLYLGGVCILAGIALVVDLHWAFVLLLPGLVACHYVLIAPEERYLAARFGEEYRGYAATVPRWFGRVRTIA